MFLIYFFSSIIIFFSIIYSVIYLRFIIVNEPGTTKTNRWRRMKWAARTCEFKKSLARGSVGRRLCLTFCPYIFTFLSNKN